MTKYDCTKDVMAHKAQVKQYIRAFTELLRQRAENHDNSKLEGFERATFNLWTPRLKEVEFGSPEYKAALEGMGDALKHHYENNRHHPEHYPNGVSGMTLHDLVEMVCDWMAAAQAKGTTINLSYLKERFGINDQLAEIINNTLREEDFYNQINGVPVGYFSPDGPSIPENMRKDDD
jgi:hypothetical protein